MEDKIGLDCYDTFESKFILAKDKELDVEVYVAQLVFKSHSLQQNINLSEKGVERLLSVLTQILPIIKNINLERVSELIGKLEQYKEIKDK